METKKDLTDFQMLLLLKNQLILSPIDTLKKIYSDISCYLVFIDSVALMLNEEDAFLYLSKDFSNRIGEVIELHHYDILTKETIEEINDITIRLNEIDNRNTDDRCRVINNYMLYHEDLREEKYDKLDDFGYTLANDSVVFFNLKGDINETTKSDFIVSSITYFLKTIPEFFDDENVLERTKSVLENISKSGSIFNPSKRRLAKDAKLLLKTLY